MPRSAARTWRAVSRFSARIPLRIKLITAALALVAVALAVISVVSIAVLRGYLLRQADRQLTRSATTLKTHRFHHHLGRSSSGPREGRVLTEVLNPRGQPVMGILPGQGGDYGPTVPLGSAWLNKHAGQLVTVPAISGNGSWRVIITPIHYTFQRASSLSTPDNFRLVMTDLKHAGQPGIFVAAVDLGSIGSTIDTLTTIDVAVGGVVIVLLAGAGVALVRASLRPLGEIEQTAGAIAAGDLSRRVPDGDPRTEVGSLGLSLNTMLSQIEQAFRARSASEATARQSEERMRRFVADASHELRTPLSVIRCFAEYYRQRGGLREDELNHMMKRVEGEAARMGLLVDDLLLLARLDQQRPLQRLPVDMLAVSADAVQDARILAPRRDIQLTVGSGGPFLVLGDEPRLRQIIGNLVNNALTHTPDGAPVGLRLRTRGSEAAVSARVNDSRQLAHGAAGAVVLEVADHGPGLTAEQAERVFERFYRADAARTRATGGSGLGLAIVAALTAAHGGSAGVDSRPGHGATFRITLPLAPDAGAPRHPDAAGRRQTDINRQDKPGAHRARR